MNNYRIDQDGFSEDARRRMVDMTVSRMRALSIEPHPTVLLLYEQYVLGEMCKGELFAVLEYKLADIDTYLQALDRMNTIRGNFQEEQKKRRKKEPDQVEGEPSTH
jgi:hypothetical protein